jgi:hypothetical protein
VLSNADHALGTNSRACSFDYPRSRQSRRNDSLSATKSASSLDVNPSRRTGSAEGHHSFVRSGGLVLRIAFAYDVPVFGCASAAAIPLYIVELDVRVRRSEASQRSERKLRAGGEVRCGDCAVYFVEIVSNCSTHVETP